MEKWYIRGMVGIYKITSPTGRVYIGQSWDIKGRFRFYKCVGSRTQKILHRSFAKYGINNHTFNIIHELPLDISQEILDEYEIFYLEHYKSLNINMLNIKGAGRGGKHTSETKALMSKQQKESHAINPNRNSGQWRAIYQYEIGGQILRRFNSVAEAARDTGICQSCIINCAAGRTSHAGGFLWRR